MYRYKWYKSGFIKRKCVCVRVSGKDLQGCLGQAWYRRVSQPVGIYPAHRSQYHTETTGGG